MLRPDSFARFASSARPLGRAADDDFDEEFSEGDVFVFGDGRRHDDLDVIVDFRPGFDKVDLSRTRKFSGADFEELLASAEQVGPDIVIDMGQGTLTFENLDLADLEAADFIF